MTIDTFKRILEQTYPFVDTIQLFFQGEPLLNPALPYFIRLAHQRNIYTIVSTNAQSLDRNIARRLAAAGLNRLIVSVDGLTQESYEQYRTGGKLNRVLYGLQHVQRAKQCWNKAMIIEMQVLRLRSNEEQWADFRRQYRHLGADRLVFKTAQFYNYQNGKPLMPSNEHFSRYQTDHNGEYHLKKRQKRICKRLIYGCVISTQGDILPCCYDKDYQFRFGNILSMSFDDIWHSTQARTFRKAVRKKTVHICSNCGG